jgi:DNA-binding NarL/FixJ family response regulator
VSAIRVLLADDHSLVRAGIRSLLGAMADVQVVAEASSGEEALELAAREQPDVVLMDIAMKGITGLDAAARMRERHPGVRVVILSMHSGEEYVLQALRAGAAGYLLKDAATGELELALRSVMRGESWLSPAVSRQVVEGYVQRAGAEAPPDVLTARQREVLRLVAGGKSTQPLREDGRDAPRADHGTPGNPRRAGSGALRVAHRSRAAGQLTVSYLIPSGISSA